MCIAMNEPWISLVTWSSMDPLTEEAGVYVYSHG